MDSRLGAEHELLVVGAGAHARSVLGALADVGCRVLGLVADGGEPGDALAGARWLGGLDRAAELAERHPGARWVMAIGDNYQRLRIMRAIQDECAAEFTPLVHPSAVLAPDVRLGEGSVVMPGAAVMAGCELGPCALVNTRASLDHESVLQEAASLAPGVVTGGRVHIGRRSFIGIGSVIAHKIDIGADTVVGAGSLVLSDVPGNVVAYGRPASVVRRRKQDEPYL